MVKVTEQAKHELKKILSNKTDWTFARLRLSNKGGGCLGFDIDIESPGDQIIEHNGTNLLLVEPELSNKLDGIIIDVGNTLYGPKLYFSSGVM